MTNHWFNYGAIEQGPTTGSNPAWWLYHRSLSRDRSKNKNLIVNEWICSSIGWHLRLPIPPFSVVRKTGVNTRYFSSLDFGERDISPSDMKPTILCQKQPELSAGIVAFDVLIANPDRHEGNVKVDSPLKPVKVRVFDHDIALLGEVQGKGTARLQMLSNRLGFTKRLSTSYEMNRIGENLVKSEHLGKWLGKIETIPDWFINEVCQESRKYGASAEEAQACSKFLNSRKKEVGSIIDSNRSFFANVDDWGLFS